MLQYATELPVCASKLSALRQPHRKKSAAKRSCQANWPPCPYEHVEMFTVTVDCPSSHEHVCVYIYICVNKLHCSLF
jgi:hypothetical protein